MTHYLEIASLFVRIAVNLILIGTPISIGVFIVLRLTRAAPPRARYLLTLTAFLAAAALPFVVTIAPTAETPRHPTSVNTSGTDSIVPGIPPPVDSREPREMLPRNQPDPGAANLLGSLVRWLSHPTLSIALFTLWLAGACLLLAREAASHVRVLRARYQWTPASKEILERLAWPDDIPLFVHNEFGPCALGVLNPVVVIPAHLLDELSITAARQIAQHELDHLKWRDPLVYSAMRIVRAVLWPSAPLWYLHRATLLEREAASDRAAVNSTLGTLQPNVAALEYASTLVSIARRCAWIEGLRKHAWVATEVGNESGLNDRIRRLMAVPSRLSGTRLSLAFITLVVSGSSLIVLPVARLETKRSESRNAETAQPQFALPNVPPLKVEPARQHANKTARLSSLTTRLPGQVQAGDKVPTPQQNRPDAVIEDVGLIKPIELRAPTAYVNTVQRVQDLQLEILKSQMAALGYKDLTTRQLEEMRAYAVGPAYVAEMADSGYSGLSADMLIKFKWLAVSSSFIREMRALGYDNLSPLTLVSFRQHGVNAEYIRQMRSRLSGSISAEQMDLLRFHGTSTEFVDRLRAMGYANLNADQLISMRLQGVSIAYIEDLHARGYKGLSANDVIGMRMRGGN